jgi:CspA family cold shock protein
MHKNHFFINTIFKLIYKEDYFMAKTTGVVKWFDNERGYGFISCNNGNDVFVHHSQVKEKGSDKDLHENESVTFDVEDGNKGQMAINVQKL